MIQKCPYEYNKVVSYYSTASEKTVKNAINQYFNGRKYLSLLTSNDKINIFEKVSDLIQNDYKNDILATTILGQGKTIHQAEIDAVCELGDFLNFNNYFYNNLIRTQPYLENSFDSYNISKWIPLNGFVASITPFNFTAIGANLASAPLLMGNYVIWKPSDYSMLSNYLYFKILLEAGMPPECISFVPSEPNNFVNTVSTSEILASLCFTGSSDVFENIYQKIGNNIIKYVNFPSIIGETGGMNYHFIFDDAD